MQDRAACAEENNSQSIFERSDKERDEKLEIIDGRMHVALDKGPGIYIQVQVQKGLSIVASQGGCR